MSGDLQEQAKRHLWMHFTRMGSYADARDPGHRARRRLLRLRRARQALSGRAVGALLRQHWPRPRRARRGGGRAGAELAFYTNWSYAHPARDRAGHAHRRAGAGQPEPRVLHLRRLGGGRVGWKLAKAYHACAASRRAQAHRPRPRLPRHLARRAVGDRPDGVARAVRTADARGAARPEHELLPLGGGPRPAVGGRRDRGGDRVRGPADGRGGDPRAGPERRRLLRARRTATSSACARSATATACCSSPTR